jgi:hypothetical protein
MIKISFFIGVIIILFSCRHQNLDDKNGIEAIQSNKTANKLQIKSPSFTDTLQFIHFEGNFDYWSGVFLNASKDTVTLVTDSNINESLINKLFEVKWFVDTLVEAGDNDSKALAKRLSSFKPIHGNPFVEPITEEKFSMTSKSPPKQEIST